jgi:hypothetical protein
MVSGEAIRSVFLGSALSVGFIDEPRALPVEKNVGGLVEERGRPRGRT